MASQDYTIELLLKANNQLSGELTKIQWQIDKLDKQVNTTSDSVNSAFSRIWNIIRQWAIVGAIAKIGQSIRDLTTAFEPVENSFYRLSETAWIVWEDMLQAMRNASMWTVSDLDLMSQANKAYSLWVVNNIEDMTTLIEISRLKWQAMWRTMEEALWDIVTWLGRASPLILDNLWITIKLSEAQEKYAAQIWKTADQLTEAEKKQALVNAVVEEWKRELEEAGEVSLTTQERFNKLQAQFENIAVAIWQQVMPWVNYFLDELNAGVENWSNAIVTWLSRVIDKFATWLNTIKAMIQSRAELYANFLVGIWVEIKNHFTNAINWFIGGINSMIDKINWAIWTSIWHISEVSKDSVTMWDMMSSARWNVKETWRDFADDYMKVQDEIKNKTNNTTGSIKNMWNALNNVVSWWGWKWSNKTSEAIKEIKNQYELLTYNVDEQYKKIQELNKERKEWYDELADKFKEADKNVKDLSKSVWDLKQKLADLNKDETSDIATEFVNARKELQKMERDYAWIWEVAKQYSLDYLENYQHWWIGKYDIDALIQYKKYSDEMASVYDWLNDSERQAMDEQIAYQERYQSLNGIEKIKEDYRIKREEIQSELNEKMSALRQEELKRAEIDKQMKQYSKERLQAIDNEIKKYAYMVWEKKRYEKEYMDQLEIDYKRQQQMYDDLIRKAKELAKVRSETWWPDWKSTRANGWPVYSWQQYLVWEHWPELFIPSQNWSIVKNEDLWKWQEFTINVNMWWVVVNDWQDTQQMAEEIANTITRQLELYKKGIY